MALAVIVSAIFYCMVIKINLVCMVVDLAPGY